MAPRSAVPGTSIVAGSSERVAGTYLHASASATSPTGTFTRKIGRQPNPAISALTINPPATWPTTAAIPAVAP